jgi:alpha/beta superfamily hydrolase
MLWIAGGFDWGIDEGAWEAAPRENDQSARAFREAGMVLLLPSLRGCAGNPGDKEFFLGEVDDVLAALRYLAKRPDVDPQRIYLGGHSTGGTLALLAAESGAPVAGVYAFGPTHSITAYGGRYAKLPEQELRLRDPVTFLAAISVPTWVIEGERGNVYAFAPLKAAAAGAPVHFVTIAGATHFSGLGPASQLLARHLAARKRSDPPFAPDADELAAALRPAPAPH